MYNKDCTWKNSTSTIILIPSAWHRNYRYITSTLVLKTLPILDWGCHLYANKKKQILMYLRCSIKVLRNARIFWKHMYSNNAKANILRTYLCMYLIISLYKALFAWSVYSLQRFIKRPFSELLTKSRINKNMFYANDWNTSYLTWGYGCWQGNSKKEKTLLLQNSFE